MRTRIATLILAASAFALGGCAYGDLGLGLGYGSPYGTYGYGGYGYGSPYYGGYGYGSPYYGGYGYGSPYGYYGSPYYGWYNGFYYPGSGYYVYDSYRRPYPMTSSQRTYWMKRQPKTSTTTVTPNWSGFKRQPSLAPSAQQRMDQRIERRNDRLTSRSDRRSERLTTRTERQSTRATSDTDTTTDRPRRRR